MSTEITSTHYVKDGIKYDRVTSILDIVHNKSLQKFRNVKGGRYVDDIFKIAAARGTRFHKLLAGYAKDKKDMTGALEFGEYEMLEEYKLIKLWVDANVTKIYHIEKTFYNKKLRIAGTIDLIGEVNNKLTVLDWKTGAKVQEISRLQLAAYTALSGLKIKQRIIVHAHDGKVVPTVIKTAQALDYNLFLYAYYLNKEFNK